MCKRKTEISVYLDLANEIMHGDGPEKPTRRQVVQDFLANALGRDGVYGVLQSFALACYEQADNDIEDQDLFEDLGNSLDGLSADVLEYHKNQTDELEA